VRAVVYHGPFEAVVEEVPDPRIEQPDDVIVRITSTCICPSDLRMYEGRTAAEPGTVLGHEDLGIVEEVGAGVIALEPGDRVVMPFTMACGFCKNCQAGATGSCLTAAPSRAAGGAKGHVALGPHAGGQAEYLRVPCADFNCLLLPAGTDHESDYVLLADVFPSGYHGCELAGVAPGDTVAVYGADPVGLMAAYSALLCGASRVFVVDDVPDRLARVREIGAIAVDAADGDPAQQIRDQTDGAGTDRGVAAVGYPAAARTGSRGEPATVLYQLVQTVRPTGGLGVPGHCVPGHCVPIDGDGVDEDVGQQMSLMAIGALFEKGLRLGTGQADVQRYDRQLRDLITAGRATPSFVVSHELPLEEAPSAYQDFGQRADGHLKVVLKPDAGWSPPTTSARADRKTYIRR
jgi:glutathione-independent formaldehyde dehydrogenase